MTRNTLHDAGTSRDEQRESADADALDAIVEPTDDGAEVTVYPKNVDEDDLLTTWITVDADSVADLDTWR
ncbi:DUF7511 domain-containing protein [Haloarchaeobius sp. DFWS5]|uniref:DUF7511 domain-containing protein n=1 Tax=Haloarchaeobius sp. DFWS5 TaxID=3446114 RepID=UPI003EBFCDB9